MGWYQHRDSRKTDSEGNRGMREGDVMLEAEIGVICSEGGERGYKPGI